MPPTPPKKRQKTGDDETRLPEAKAVSHLPVLIRYLILDFLAEGKQRCIDCGESEFTVPGVGHDFHRCGADTCDAIFHLCHAAWIPDMKIAICRGCEHDVAYCHSCDSVKDNVLAVCIDCGEAVCETCDSFSVCTDCGKAVCETCTSSCDLCLEEFCVWCKDFVNGVCSPCRL